jgi:steroid 5-alpha reductase family enzyme
MDLLNIWIVLMVSVALACFIASELTNNYSQVDKLWSLIPIAYAWITYFYNNSGRILLMAILVTLWGARLTFNFARKGGYNIIPWRGEEDYRWKIMREVPLLKGRIRFGIFNLLFISFYQNLVILLFSSPLLAAAGGRRPIGYLDIIAAVLFLSFLAIETIADNQLFSFHRQKRLQQAQKYKNSVEKGFMTEGLWRIVRHPNFTSEQGIWVSFYLFSIAAGSNILNYSGTGALLLILLFMGSTRLTEKISSGKYPLYKNYQTEVPMVLPSIRAFIIKK